MGQDTVSVAAAAAEVAATHTCNGMAACDNIGRKASKRHLRGLDETEI